MDDEESVCNLDSLMIDHSHIKEFENASNHQIEHKPQLVSLISDCFSSILIHSCILSSQFFDRLFLVFYKELHSIESYNFGLIIVNMLFLPFTFGSLSMIDSFGTFSYHSQSFKQIRRILHRQRIFIFFFFGIIMIGFSCYFSEISNKIFDHPNELEEAKEFIHMYIIALFIYTNHLLNLKVLQLTGNIQAVILICLVDLMLNASIKYHLLVYWDMGISAIGYSQMLTSCFLFLISLRFLISNLNFTFSIYKIQKLVFLSPFYFKDMIRQFLSGLVFSLDYFFLLILTVELYNFNNQFEQIFLVINYVYVLKLIVSSSSTTLTSNIIILICNKNFSHKTDVIRFYTLILLFITLILSIVTILYSLGLLAHIENNEDLHHFLNSYSLLIFIDSTVSFSIGLSRAYNYYHYLSLFPQILSTAALVILKLWHSQTFVSNWFTLYMLNLIFSSLNIHFLSTISLEKIRYEYSIRLVE